MAGGRVRLARVCLPLDSRPSFFFPPTPGSLVSDPPQPVALFLFLPPVFSFRSSRYSSSRASQETSLPFRTSRKPISKHCQPNPVFSSQMAADRAAQAVPTPLLRKYTMPLAVVPLLITFGPSSDRPVARLLPTVSPVLENPPAYRLRASQPWRLVLVHHLNHFSLDSSLPFFLWPASPLSVNPRPRFPHRPRPFATGLRLIVRPNERHAAPKPSSRPPATLSCHLAVSST
ncbi:hypothetical protein IWX90DRAFT_96777 [Phyllosticta citrichinensis]|uniref:Uncharacterized protein n=1 Tax=Phyllosticta citrichinensis TaxID=1130410 RepID=A0ABR1XES3_9PEZI